MFARLLPYIRTQELQEEETVRDFLPGGPQSCFAEGACRHMRHSTKPWPRNSSRGASATAVLSMPTSCAGSLLPIRQRCDGSPGMRISIRRLWCAMMSIKTANACWAEHPVHLPVVCPQHRRVPQQVGLGAVLRYFAGSENIFRTARTSICDFTLTLTPSKPSV